MLEPQATLMLFAATLLAVWQAAAYAALAIAVSVIAGTSGTAVIVAQLLLLGLGALIGGMPLPPAVAESALPIAAGALLSGALFMGSILFLARWRVAILEPMVAIQLGTAPLRLAAGLVVFAAASMVITAASRMALDAAPTAWSPVICALALPPSATLGCAAAAGGAELLMLLITAPLPATVAGIVIAGSLALMLSRSRGAFT